MFKLSALFDNIKNRIRQELRTFLFPPASPGSPCQAARRLGARIAVGDDTLLLESAQFRFDVPTPDNRQYISIGEKCVIGGNFIFESAAGKISVGERTYIGGGVNLISRVGISIGNDVIIAWGCYVYDHNSHSLHWQDRRQDIEQFSQDFRRHQCGIINKDWSTVKAKPIMIQDKAWIGFEATILKGVTIGEGAIVGAKSVVVTDVEPWTVVAGNPARLIKRLSPEDR
ncbi:MAG TPA: acyltransferase [Methylomusa anaerophila]|uniref:Putative acetyltransferase n=1 Tax=Methylomusa anaerophila TaxID=1930071 RepID=A0A348AKN7_9FIRM|nr:acyltransferase [Methylomusa anaerophila]BBB91635.1 putative acetyltransferase [Methylomusa anaerophila]HML89427.1 acyltransferase [Methylomusa anaerophila]